MPKFMPNMGLARISELGRRNFVEDGAGVLTDCRGNRWYVDLEDFPKCSQELWSDNGLGYAKSGRVGYLHRLLCPGWQAVDHVNHDLRNNHRSNLRDGSNGINQHNRGKKPGSSNPYKGVYRVRNKWQARVVIFGAMHHLGTFETPAIAAGVLRKHVESSAISEAYQFA